MSVRAMDPLRPRRPGGMGRGAAIAIGVHVLLLIALAVGVNWRTSEPQNVTAELWAAVPETAAPAPVTPPTPPQPKPVENVVEPPPQPAKPEPPPPREADIALEKEKEQQRLKALAEEEREKAEALKKKKELAAKQKEEEVQRQAQAEAAQAAQREANLKRLQGLAGATGAPTATGTGQRDAGPKGPSAGYGDRIRSRVKPNIVMTEATEGSPRAEVKVRAAPDGAILSRRLIKSSGDKNWDEAVLRAIDRTGVLPRDTDGTVPSPIIIFFTP
jgi:colicin import membrane protein